MTWGKCWTQLNRLIRMVSSREHLNSTHNVLIPFSNWQARWTKKLQLASLNLHQSSINLEISFKLLNFKLKALFSKKESLAMIILKQHIATLTLPYTITLVAISARPLNTCIVLLQFWRCQEEKTTQIFHQSIWI